MGNPQQRRLYSVSAIAIGGIVFVCVFGGALLGVFLHSTLPEHHLSTDTKDVVKLAIALVATMSALLLSLLVATAKSAYDTRSNQLTQMSADIVVLDRLLVHYGPETKEARALLRSSVATGLERFRPADHGGPASLEPTGAFEIIYDKIEELSPHCSDHALHERVRQRHTRDRLDFANLQNSKVCHPPARFEQMPGALRAGGRSRLFGCVPD